MRQHSRIDKFNPRVLKVLWQKRYYPSSSIRQADHVFVHSIEDEPGNSESSVQKGFTSNFMVYQVQTVPYPPGSQSSISVVPRFLGLGRPSVASARRSTEPCQPILAQWLVQGIIIHQLKRLDEEEERADFTIWLS